MVKYCIRVIIITSLHDLKYEEEITVINPLEPSVLSVNNEEIKLDVGIEDKLKLQIKFFSKNNALKSEMLGEVTFKKVNIELQSMELMIMKREIMKGENDYEPAILAKYEIMDGLPYNNEVVPLRLYLKPYALTPTYDEVNKKFSVKYFINLVLIDMEGKKYFKQREVVLFRIKKQKNDTK